MLKELGSEELMARTGRKRSAVLEVLAGRSRPQGSRADVYLRALRLRPVPAGRTARAAAITSIAEAAGSGTIRHIHELPDRIEGHPDATGP